MYQPVLCTVHCAVQGAGMSSAQTEQCTDGTGLRASPHASVVGGHHLGVVLVNWTVTAHSKPGLQFWDEGAAIKQINITGHIL